MRFSPESLAGLMLAPIVMLYIAPAEELAVNVELQLGGLAGVPLEPLVGPSLASTSRVSSSYQRICTVLWEKPNWKPIREVGCYFSKTSMQTT